MKQRLKITGLKYRKFRTEWIWNKVIKKSSIKSKIFPFQILKSHKFTFHKISFPDLFPSPHLNPLQKIPGEWKRKKKMKDCILITMCISVTDARNYDIKNDFHCFLLLLLPHREKLLLLLLFKALMNTGKFFYSFSNQRR